MVPGTVDPKVLKNRIEDVFYPANPCGTSPQELGVVPEMVSEKEQVVAGVRKYGREGGFCFWTRDRSGHKWKEVEARMDTACNQEVEATAVFSRWKVLVLHGNTRSPRLGLGQRTIDNRDCRGISPAEYVEFPYRVSDTLLGTLGCG